MRKILLSLFFPFVSHCVYAETNAAVQADNVIYAEDVNITLGTTTANLIVNVKSQSSVNGCQFDLYLPDGISVLTDADGDYAISTGDIVPSGSFVVDSRVQSNGALRVILYSMANASLTANSGNVATIRLAIDKDMENGDYPIQLRKVEIANTQCKTGKKTDIVEGLLRIDGDPIATDIRGIAADGNNDMYNTQGQRVTELHHGQIGVTKGKKIVNK